MKVEIDLLVASMLAEGTPVIEVHGRTYWQHCLREHPNVCRQELAGTGRYRLHSEPCNCPPKPVRKPVQQGTCCGLAQPHGSLCMLCDDTVA